MLDRKLVTLLGVIPYLTSCSSWQISDRQNFIADCTASLDQQSNRKYSAPQLNLYCTCLQSETEARFAPDQVGTLPAVVVHNCARKANITPVNN